MKSYTYILILLSILTITGCGNKANRYTYLNENNTIDIKLEQSSDTIYSLNLYLNDSLYSEWELKYPVYNIDFGDIDNDGSPDILVGVIKTTRFDPSLNKRLFIFKVTKDYYIRPKWLGSRMGQPLESFKLTEANDQTIIRSIEKEKDGTYLVADYKWRGFGLEFIEYVERNISLNKAETLLKNQ